MKVAQAGIDTWSVCWRVAEDSPAARAMDELATVPAARSRLLEESLAGHRVGWFPASRLVFAEGHPGGDRLGSPEALPAARDVVERAISDYGIALPRGRARSRWGGVDRPQCADSLPGFAGVRRLDATLDLTFDSSSEGLALLAGVAALQFPRMKSAVWRETSGHRVETVALYGHSGKKMLGRWYDKGVESGTAKRGTLIRPEDQRRWPSQTRRDVEELSSTYVRDKFQQRFAPLWRASKGITVATADELGQKLAQLTSTGDVWGPRALQLLGHLHAEQAGLDIPVKPRTRRRYASECRDLGLVPVPLAPDEAAPLELDLHDVLAEVLETDAWERRG